MPISQLMSASRRAEPRCCELSHDRLKLPFNIFRLPLRLESYKMTQTHPRLSMRPAYRADEAKSPLPFLPGNRRAYPSLATQLPQARIYKWALCWLPALTLGAVLNGSAQTLQPATVTAVADSGQSDATSLPDSPGTIWMSLPAPSSETLDFDGQNPGPFDTHQNRPAGKNGQPQAPCTRRAHRGDYSRFHRDPCDPYRSFVEVSVPPLTPTDKGYLAFHDVTDPFNLLTIAATSAFTIGINSHTAYGPGMRGFGYNVGTSLGQDVTGEFIGTFAVCSLFRQDPRYFRMPNAKPLRRLAHAISHIAVAQGDNGKPMPNYANFIAGAAGAVIANQYVPGLATDAASTTERIFTGFLTEPVGNIIAEFLPDFAARIHVRDVVVQRLLNRIAASQ
jgi:hypothetical protein